MTSAPAPLTGTLVDLFNPDLYADIPSAEDRKVTVPTTRRQHERTPEERAALSAATREALRRKRYGLKP